jgi:hypothetical protein
MYSLYKLTKTEIVSLHFFKSVQKYVNIIKPCFQLIVQKYRSSEIPKWSKEKHMQKANKQRTKVKF